MDRLLRLRSVICVNPLPFVNSVGVHGELTIIFALNSARMFNSVSFKSSVLLIFLRIGCLGEIGNDSVKSVAEPINQVS